MVPNEVENILFTDAVDIVAIPIVPVCALQAVLKPAVLDPTCNLVVVLAMCTSLWHAAGGGQHGTSNSASLRVVAGHADALLRSVALGHSMYWDTSKGPYPLERERLYQARDDHKLLHQI